MAAQAMRPGMAQQDMLREQTAALLQEERGPLAELKLHLGVGAARCEGQRAQCEFRCEVGVVPASVGQVERNSRN